MMASFAPHRHLWSGLISDDPAAEVGVLGVPFDGAVSFRSGAASAPSKLRELSSRLACSAEEGQPLSLRVRDYGDVPADLEWSRYFQTVQDRAMEVLQHRLALFLGGDHSVSIPLMRAFDRVADSPFGIVYFDAHADLFDIYDGHRWSHACPARRALELSGLAPQHLIFVGLRSFGQKEWEFLTEHPQISFYTARQCHRSGIEAVAAEVLKGLRDVQAVYFSLDIDGLDPAYAPGTGYAEGGGLTTRDLLDLVLVLFRELPVRALDVVEVAPPLDHADTTSFAALKVIYEAWGAIQKRSERGDVGG
ncbi:MAG: agmatinase [Anaerolineae bacterium]|jgi:agmatinase